MNILNFFQSKDIKIILGNVSPDLGDSRGCLLVLFMFLSRQMIHIWLPDLINRYKQKSKQITPKSNPARSINVYCDGEANRIVGWALFVSIRKYEKKQQISNDIKDNNISDILDMLRDMKALESDIIQDADYIKKTLLY